MLPTFGTRLLTNATVVSNLQTEPARRRWPTSTCTSLRAPGARRGAFLQNPGIYASQAIANGGFSDYNALQLELRRQFRNGFFAQVNYTLSDTNTDSAGTAQNRFEAFMDNFRPRAEHRPVGVPRHARHQRERHLRAAVRRGPALAQLRRLPERARRRLAGRHDRHLQSGSPVTIFSGRGTFNRAGRSNCGDPIGCNTAFSTLSADEIKKLIGVFKQPDGKIYWIDPKVIDPATGRAVGADNLGNTAGFAGQVFFNPAAGEVGNLPVMAFDGPPQFSIDLALSKRSGSPTATTSSSRARRST